MIPGKFLLINHIRRLFIFLFFGVIGLLFGRSTACADPIAVPGTRVTIEKPSGFEKATSFSGFQQAGSGASIMITEMPAPFAAATAGFDAEKMAERGMKLLSKADHKVGGYNGMLIELTQVAQGIPFHKWILAFGDDTFTQLVSATCPDTSATDLGPALKQSILSTTFDSSKPPLQAKDLKFQLSEVPGLKLAALVQNAVIFNPSGQLPKEKLDHTPVSFIAAQSISIGKMEIADKPKYARERLLVSPELKGTQVLTEADVTIAAISGREILATAKSKSDEDLFVYQVMLFPGDGYYLMRAECPVSQRKECEPMFKALARTFKLKQ